MNASLLFLKIIWVDFGATNWATRCPYSTVTLLRILKSADALSACTFKRARCLLSLQTWDSRFHCWLCLLLLRVTSCKTFEVLFGSVHRQRFRHFSIFTLWCSWELKSWLDCLSYLPHVGPYKVFLERFCSFDQHVFAWVRVAGPINWAIPRLVRNSVLLNKLRRQLWLLLLMLLMKWHFLLHCVKSLITI